MPEVALSSLLQSGNAVLFTFGMALLIVFLVLPRTRYDDIARSVILDGKGDPLPSLR